jgi:hypothetical protein
MFFPRSALRLWERPLAATRIPRVLNGFVAAGRRSHNESACAGNRKPTRNEYNSATS